MNLDICFLCVGKKNIFKLIKLLYNLLKSKYSRLYACDLNPNHT